MCHPPPRSAQVWLLTRSLFQKVEVDTYTKMVSDAVAVDCYAGYRGEETPRRFTLENELVEIRMVVDQWRTLDHRYFKVRTAASESYTLRQDVRSGMWALTEV